MEEVKEGSVADGMEANDVDQLFSKLSSICKSLEEKGEKVLVLTTTAKHGLAFHLGNDVIPGTPDMLEKFQRFCKDEKNSHKLSSMPTSQSTNMGQSELESSGQLVTRLVDVLEDNTAMAEEAEDADGDGVDLFSNENIGQLADHESMEICNFPDKITKSSDVKPIGGMETDLNSSERNVPDQSLNQRRSTRINKRKTKHKPIDKYEEMMDSSEIANKSCNQSVVIPNQIDSKNHAYGNDSMTLIKCGKCMSTFSHNQHFKTHHRRIPDCETVLKDIEMDDNIDRSCISYKNTKGKEIHAQLTDLFNAQRKVPYKCIVCKKCFNRKSNFKRHLLKHSVFKQPPCRICGAQIKNRESYLRHLKDHSEKPFQCEKCDKQRFETEEALMEHSTKCVKVLKEKPICDICGHVSKCRAALKIHENSHLGVKLFPCEHCGKKLSTSTSLERHIMSMHQDETPFECEFCHKTFKVKDNYKKHLKHHEKPKYNCELCGKSCVEFGNLKKHMMTHTKEKPFVCEVCGACYARKALLEIHGRLHTGEKPYKCKEEGCGKSFRSLVHLRQHERYHSKTSPFVCDVCGKAFKQPGRMTHHRKSHFVEYSWPCAYCKMKFKTIFLYKSHLARQHGEMKKDIEERTNIRLHQCHICPRVFGDKEDLTRHIYIHEGVKPYQCFHCSKRFNDKSNMKQHVTTHLIIHRFRCNLCRMPFNMKKDLNAHMKKNHEMKEVASVTKASENKQIKQKYIRKPSKKGIKLESNGRKLESNGRKLESIGRKLESNGRKLESNGRIYIDEDNVTHVILEDEPSTIELLCTPAHQKKRNGQSINFKKKADQSDNADNILPHFKLLKQASGDPLVTME